MSPSGLRLQVEEGGEVIRPHWEMIDRIRAYTHGQQRSLRAEYLLREEILRAAREVEEIAAELQSIADELREAIK